MSHESDNTITRDKKRKRTAIKKKIKKTFRPTDCSNQAKYKKIETKDIRSQIGGDPMDALSNIFKQYRGHACENETTLTESLPYDDKYIKMLFNQGSFQFEQFRRIYELYKKMA